MSGRFGPEYANLKLDSLNPRLSHIENEITQNELINEMIDNYKIYELAQSIAEVGFFPDKNLIAIIENGNYIVVEGNRRLSAIKALLTPEIVTGKEKNKFVKLHSIIEESFINKIKVIIAPSREDSNPIIFKEHTDKTSMPWSRIMQAEFYKKQLENNISLDVLSSQYNKPKSEIVSFLKLINMYEIACNLDFKNPEVKQKVLDKQSFNASTLERVYDSTEMKDFLKFEFDISGYIKGKTKKDDFKKAYAKIIEDIADGIINTRTLNTKEQLIDYKKTLKDYEPKSKGTFNQNQLVKNTSPVFLKKEKTASVNSKKTIQLSSGIIQRGIPFTLTGATNLKFFYDELKRLPVKSFPNSVAATLRAFLDKSLRIFLIKNRVRHLSLLVDSKTENVKLVDCTLGDIIDYLIKKDVTLLEENTKKILKQFKNSSDKISLSALNSIMHNENYSLNEKEVRDIWTKLECVFKEILLESGK